ncbi:MAG: glutamate--cysteine ligase [Agarilytica sp.]
MGLAIEREEFSKKEYDAFSERLYECLSALKTQIRSPSFGLGTPMLGAELENYIVDSQGEVLPLNSEIIKAAGSDNYTVELNKFNLEVNFDPLPLNAVAFSSLESAMTHNLDNLDLVAKAFGAHIVPTGILPTLRESHLTPKYMTNYPRYRGLSKFLLNMRGENFHVHIRGEDEIKLTSSHVALEGANTSFQYHLMVKPDEFADCFNVTQLVTPLLLAVSANSPILLDKMLWDETRIALFKQSIDSRVRSEFNWRQPARVTFGHGWVREDAWEIFAETVALYPPIFPILSNENPMSVIKAGGIPKLEELCLHMGTTWPWNRPVYSGNDGGHVRIEMRALPAGPTTVDMCANAAFATGLVMGLKHSIRDFLAVMPFRFAEYNFYRAAKNGLDASIIWTKPSNHQLVELPITDVIYEMLPLAEQGLLSIGISPQEAKFYLGLIKARLEKMRTGARWQRAMVKKFEEKHGRTEACSKMFSRYMALQKTKAPVSDWELSC